MGMGRGHLYKNKRKLRLLDQTRGPTKLVKTYWMDGQSRVYYTISKTYLERKRIQTVLHIGINSANVRFSRRNMIVRMLKLSEAFLVLLSEAGAVVKPKIKTFVYLNISI